MTCQEVQTQLSLYLYGELPFAAEDALESHLALCAFCQQALAREKEWHATLRSGDNAPSLALLSRCRSELRTNVGVLPKAPPMQVPVWRKVRAWFDVPVMDWASRGALACFLVIFGFGLGRFHEGQQPLTERFTYGFSPVLPAGVRIRDVRATDPGQVRVVIERVHEDELAGPLNDERIRNMILAATQHAVDPAVRMDSVQALVGQDGQDVRDALVSSLQHDPNAAVRLKAVEALRTFSDDPQTRQALRFVLENDHDPAVRSEAISVLVPPARQTIEIGPDLLNTLQTVVRSDPSDDYVHARAVQLLQQAGALSGSY